MCDHNNYILDRYNRICQVCGIIDRYNDMIIQARHADYTSHKFRVSNTLDSVHVFIRSVLSTPNTIAIDDGELSELATIIVDFHNKVPVKYKGDNKRYVDRYLLFYHCCMSNMYTYLQNIVHGLPEDKYKRMKTLIQRNVTDGIITGYDHIYDSYYYAFKCGDACKLTPNQCNECVNIYNSCYTTLDHSPDSIIYGIMYTRFNVHPNMIALSSATLSRVISNLKRN